MLEALLLFVLGGFSQDLIARDATAASSLPLSVKRIREALERTPAFRIELPEPTFRMEVREHLFFTDRPWTWDFAGGGVPTTEPQAGFSGTPPLVKVDVLPLLIAARKALAEHAVESEVRRAWAEFCATHRCEAR